MGMVGDIQEDVSRIRELLEDENGEEETEERNLTPEDKARREENRRLLRERIAYHEAKAREQDELRGQKPAG
jgi:NMD protein affecting ribosome stability and mRNA decay